MVVHLAAGGKERLPAAEGQPYHDPVCRVVRVPQNRLVVRFLKVHITSTDSAPLRQLGTR